MVFCPDKTLALVLGTLHYLLQLCRSLKKEKWEKTEQVKQAFKSGNSVSGNPDIVEMEEEGGKSKTKMWGFF